MPRLKSLKCFLLLIVSSVSAIFLCGYILFDDKPNHKPQLRSHFKIKSRYKYDGVVESVQTGDNDVYSEEQLLSLAQIRNLNDQTVHDEGDLFLMSFLGGK